MQDLTDDTFEKEVLKGKGLFLVDFWAPSCGPCKNLMPVVEAALTELGTSVTGVKVNIDDNPATPSAYGVMSIPTLFLFKDGKIVDTKVGSQHTQEDLVTWVKGALS